MPSASALVSCQHGPTPPPASHPTKRRQPRAPPASPSCRGRPSPRLRSRRRGFRTPPAPRKAGPPPPPPRASRARLFIDLICSSVSTTSFIDGRLRGSPVSAPHGRPAWSCTGPRTSCSFRRSAAYGFAQSAI
ncbi:hypothetical protein PVAP13_7KG137000 [Panicum virgatum]|uniref:Uncharacterized protein n=1 Tax=Panicum virgatum TaxID=38727 RepID=A0A8T0QLA4_PANVG|nr:hypothetical protein PVAP13_7KG137000 [Panicum virgatum]